MNNKRIVIDAGHGGIDGGAVANGIVEKDLTLKISEYMKNRFDEFGIESSLTRDSDITLNPSDRVNKVLDLYGNDSDVIVISNHINAGGGDGAEIIYALRNNDTLSKKIGKELENAGQNVRKYYQRRLPSDSSKDYYFMLRNTPDTESIIVEYGFLDSKGDDINLLKNDYERLAEATVKGVLEYLGIPYSNNIGEYYTVKSGDTLWSIAKKFNLTVDKLKEMNNLSGSLLTVGQKLIVNNEIGIGEDFYIVQAGDTLYSIARRYNLSVDELKELNNLVNNTLGIGQKLKIKKDKDEVAEDIIEDVEKYVVKSGDTLYKISKMFNIDIDKIKEINNLESDILSVGQELLLKENIVGNDKIYTVMPGDTLYSIARKFDTTVSVLSELNNLGSALLSIGQKLLLP